MPTAQRILVANSLWESVEAEEDDATEAEIDVSWDAEIGRRIAEIEVGTAVIFSLGEVELGLQTIVGS